MAVAASMHTDNGFFAQDGGYEYPAVLALVVAVGLVFRRRRTALTAASQTMSSGETASSELPAATD